ncbi:MAG: toprim domain-containing protein [Deltaproteobacteria bacterium]|nr:toprim domain-containing protein [Deltaproteobacteria bacterium]
MTDSRPFIEAVKAANPILPLARELGVKVSAKGMARCFFPAKHANGDADASLRFDSRRNNVTCWVCGYHWDSIEIVRHLKDCTFNEAVSFLAQRAGLSVGRFAAAPRTSPQRAALPARPGVPEATRRGLLTTFARGAMQELDRGGRDYLHGRDLSDETITAYALGYVDDYDAFIARHFSQTTPQELAYAGLGPLRRFAQAGVPFVTIPYFTFVDEDGTRWRQCTFLKARAVGDDLPDDLPKYLSTSGNIPSPYNAWAIRDERLFVAEGEFDCLTLVQHGFNAIGVPGATGFKTEWLTYLEGREVVLALDPDKAGRKGARELLQLLRGHARSLRRVNLPPGRDLNEFFTDREGS